MKANVLKKVERIFCRLLNEDSRGGLEMRENTSFVGLTFYRRIRIVEAKKALAQTKTGNAMGPGSILMETWVCLG